MTSIQGPARDQYLTALAQVIGSGATQSPESLEAVAKDVAKDIAAAHNVDATDLFETAPAQWLKNPSDYGVKTEAQSFLQIARTVLQVPMATVSPIATRGVQSAKDMDIQIALTRSDAVKNNPRPAEFLEEIDLATVAPRDLMNKVEALAKHPRFADLFGVRSMSHHDVAFFADVARMAAGVVADIQSQGPAPEVRAGGVPVSGPAYEATLSPVLTVPLTQKMSLIALTYAMTRTKLVLSNIDETELRSAVSPDCERARAAGLVCGPWPPRHSGPANRDQRAWRDGVSKAPRLDGRGGRPVHGAAQRRLLRLRSAGVGVGALRPHLRQGRGLARRRRARASRRRQARGGSQGR